MKAVICIALGCDLDHKLVGRPKNFGTGSCLERLVQFKYQGLDHKLQRKGPVPVIRRCPSLPPVRDQAPRSFSVHVWAADAGQLRSISLDNFPQSCALRAALLIPRAEMIELIMACSHLYFQSVERALLVPPESRHSTRTARPSAGC